MEFLDKSEAFLRYQYSRYGVRALWACMGAAFVLILLCGASDAFVPDGIWWNLIRTAVAVPTALAVFGACYFLGLGLHYSKLQAENSTWVPFRFRLSFAWRVRVSVLIAVFLYLPVYAVHGTNLMTAVSAGYLSAIAALLLFCRTSVKEREMQKKGIPDIRDARMSKAIREREEERERKREEKKNRRKS